MQEGFEDAEKKRKIYELKLDRPYGSYKATCVFPLEDDDKDKQFAELDKDSLIFFKSRCEPKPISAAEQEHKDNLEEEENKQKE